jgi:IS5 family transposase
MIEDFADLCTYVYVLTDESYRDVAAPYDTRPGPRSAFTDSEVITLTLAAELLGLDAETRFLAYVRRNHAALFPLLPERSRYNRRRRQLVEVTNRIRGAIMARLWRVLEAEGRDLCVVDSVPVPVIGYHHAPGDHRWWGEADFGRVPSKKQHVYGFKLHLLISHSGLILDFALAPANHHDGTLTAQLLADKAGLTVLGDKGYINGPLQAQLATAHDLVLLTPKRRNQLAQLPTALTQAINHFRQVIETINSQLVGQFNLQRNRAKSLFGLCARVQAKLTAHTVGLYLNYLLGRPLRALMDLALI